MPHNFERGASNYPDYSSTPSRVKSEPVKRNTEIIDKQKENEILENLETFFENNIDFLSDCSTPEKEAKFIIKKLKTINLTEYNVKYINNYLKSFYIKSEKSDNTRSEKYLDSGITQVELNKIHINIENSFSQNNFPKKGENLLDYLEKGENNRNRINNEFIFQNLKVKFKYLIEEGIDEYNDSISGIISIGVMDLIDEGYGMDGENISLEEVIYGINGILVRNIDLNRDNTYYGGIAEIGKIAFGKDINSVNYKDFLEKTKEYLKGKNIIF